MQAQAIRTETNQDVLTAQQSLQSIQTLLKAGLGCITYLRNLLPADNFSENYLTSANTSSFSSQPSNSFASDSSRRNVSGFKVMTVTRGYTEEADKLLDFLETGIFDALQKQYLRSFVFAVYLDNDDPNNIVEAYTFNFQYHTVPGTDSVVPVMTLGEDLMKLSLSNDPVAEATKKGRVPTLGDVKRSLKSLVKNLIQVTTQMDALPKRRYATFKLFYHDHTPDDYEPAHFRAGDVDKDKWFFSTHNPNERPEKCSIGRVQTGWHGVDVQVTSVSGYLPSAEDNDAPFLGTTQRYGHMAPPLTPAQEATTRAQQVEAQKKDAEARTVVWDAEDGLADVDAESEDETEATCALETWRVGRDGLESVAPMGMRDGKGNIVPLPAKEKGKESLQSLGDVHYVGAKVNVPNCVGDLVNPTPTPDEIPETQPIAEAQLIGGIDKIQSPLSSPDSSPSPTPRPHPPKHKMSLRPKINPASDSSLPPSDLEASSIPSVSSYPGQETLSTQALKNLLQRSPERSSDADEVMLNMETQVETALSDLCDEPLSSSSPNDKQNTVGPQGLAIESDAVECECSVTAEDCDFVSCDGCKKWFHVWCMGYHDAKDKNIPAVFVCFDCRVRSDQNWDLIMVHNLYPRMMERFKSLALFRRAIKVYEKHNPNGLSAFSKLIGCESIVAGQLFKRLETEDFIAQGIVLEDSSLFLETTSRNTRSKARTTKPKQALKGKSAQKPRYSFQYAIKKSQKYLDYFTPTPEVERRILDLAALKPARKSRAADTDINMDLSSSQIVHVSDIGDSQDNVLPSITESHDFTQTQDETQILSTPHMKNAQIDLATKRKTSSPGTGRAAKKIKISVGPAVDLGD